MAYLDKETKTILDSKCKQIAKKHGLKITTKRNHYSTIVLTIRGGKLDFIGNYLAKKKAYADSHYTGIDLERAESTIEYTKKSGYVDVNQYWLKDSFDGKPLEVLEEFTAELFGNGYFDKSDIQTDYFHTSWYVDVKVGEYGKPYLLEGNN